MIIELIKGKRKKAFNCAVITIERLNCLSRKGWTVNRYIHL